MKKSFSKAVLLLTLASFAGVQTVPAPAHALVGVAAWNPILIGLGFGAYAGAGVVAGLGAAGVDAIVDHAQDSKKGMTPLDWIGAGVSGLVTGVGAVVSFAGFIVLDGSSSRSLEFTQLSESDATKLGITSDELESYNSNLDQANAIEANVESDLSKIKNPTPQQSYSAWSQYSDALPAQTFSAMQKIATQANKGAR